MSDKKYPSIDISDAAKSLGVESDCLEYYSWPEVFGSTCGPFGGVGGQMISTFQMEAWSDGYIAFIFCNGKKVKQVSRWAMCSMRGKAYPA